MDNEIQNFGSYLEDCVNSNDEKSAGKLIKYVRNYLMENVEANVLDYMLSKVFDDTYNLLKFLHQISDKGWKASLTEGLNLLEHFLKNFKEQIQPHNIEIAKTCRHIATSKASAFEKTKALDILSKILYEGSDVPFDDVKAIYDQFYKFCGIHQNITSQKIQKHVFGLLGLIAKKYPYLVTNAENLIDLYIQQLNRQSETSEKNREKNIVSGCIGGLSDILETFPVNDQASKSKVYLIIKKMLLAGSNATYDIRDVVLFVSKNCSLIAENMYNDCPELWHDTIKQWVLKSGDNRKAGYMALEVYYTEIANVLKTRTDDRDKQIFQYFYNYFLETMKNETADIIHIRLAIRGYGAFSVPCKAHITSQNLSKMFVIIVHRMEQDYFVKDTPSMEQLEFLPDYIHCLSTILYQIGEYSFEQIKSLQQISVLMIKTFPKLSTLYHYSVFEAMLLTMYYLHEYNPKILENYLQSVVYQGVIWTCSHRTVFDIDLNYDDDDSKSITYRNYLPLWRNLLAFVNSSHSKYEHIPKTTRQSIIKIFYDELIKTLLLLINKLNLNTKYLEDVPVIDPLISCEAEKLDDYIIFINVVDFYLDLLKPNTNYYFKKWIKMFSNQVISKSYKYPYVSGFYKLLKLNLQICDQLNYFEEEETNTKTITSFLEKVIQKVEEFKDDLQISCLELLLSIPVTLIQPLLPTMGPVFNTSLTLGKSYLKLALTTIDTLNKWYKVLPEEDLKPLLKIILPHFDAILRSKGFSGDTEIQLLQSKKSKRTSTKRKVVIENCGELVTLQNKILLFIGQLNTELCVHLVESSVQIEEVTWDKEPQLNFTIPYSEIKPNIYLDRLVPRIIELATTSGDQKTRITACELFHSVVIFMIGKRKKLKGLFKKVLLPIIQLSCDSNDVVRQLFNPLIFQMVHWYSSPMQVESDETLILIDELMEGISHPNNTAVRDISGKCIKEFVAWTIKQSKDTNQNYKNIENIINKLCLYSTHPNSCKRLGAALAFNNLYTILREEEILVDTFWMEIFYYLMLNMSLDDLKSSLHTQLDSALNHIERVLKEKRNLFNGSSSIRRIPSGIEGSSMKDIIYWVLQQTASLNCTYRRKSIKLFCNLVTCVDDCGTANTFIQKYNTKNSQWYFELYEKDGIGKFPKISSFQQIASVQLLNKWFQYLLRCLDTYKFLLDYKIVNFKQLITSNIHDSINYFIENISEKKLAEVINQFQNKDDDINLMPDEIEEYTEQKFTIIIGIFDYLLSDKSDSWSKFINEKTFWQFICVCVYQPHHLGFLEKSIEFEEKLIKLLNKSTSTKHLQTFFVTNYKTRKTFDVQNISLAERNLLKGRLLLNKCDKIQLNNDFSKSISDIFNALVRKTDDRIVTTSFTNTVQEYAELLLKLSLTSNQVTNICNCILTNTEITDTEKYSKTTHGEYFFNTFKEILMEYILNHFEAVIEMLCTKWIDFSDNTAIAALINILKYLEENINWKKKLTKDNIQEIFFKNISFIYDIDSSISLKNRNLQIELLSHITNVSNTRNCIIGQKYMFIKSWFIDQLNFNPKDEAKVILQFKINVLSFLHCVTGPEDDEDEDLQSALNSLQNNSELFDETDRIVLFKKLLDFLVISKSRIVLEAVLQTFLTINYDESKINIFESLKKYLSNTPDTQYKSICIVYNNCIKSSTNNNFAKIFLYQMLRICNYTSFEQFFIDYIKTIFEQLENKEQNLIQKSINLLLLDVMFSRIKCDKFTDKSCVISKAAFDNLKTGKELLIKSIGIVRNIRKENQQFEDVTQKELYRMYQCDAFNALISIISNTKKSPSDIDIYCYIFNEDIKKGEIIWESIIDCNKLIDIPQDFNHLPIRKKVFINIRNDNPNTNGNKPKYIESQTLFNSTLSEDICKFDFTNTLIRNNDLEETQRKTDEDNAVMNSLDVETVDINNHECMATICGLINHLIDNKISPLPDDVNNAILPKWLMLIRKTLNDEQTKNNVKIFFARVIHNMKFVFKYYAKYFFEPIVNVIVDGCLGNSINYFIADLVEMLITWSNKLNLNEINNDAPNKLITFLMNNAHNDRRDMLKYNLEIIKTTIEKWKNVIIVPHDVIKKHIKSSNKFVAIHLIGIILANNLNPWLDDHLDEFTKDLITFLQKEDKKEFYGATAEVLGMVLLQLSKNEELKTSFKKLYDSLESVINGFKSVDKMFYTLEQMQIHFPEIIDKFLKRIWMKMYSQPKPALKAIYLRNVLRRFDAIEIVPLTTKDLLDLLNIEDNDVRLLTLQIADKSIDSFKKPHILNLLNGIAELKMDRNPKIRCAVYDVLITTYKNYETEKDQESLNIINICKPILLAAIIDSDYEIQEKMLNFWCNDRYYNLKLSERFEKSLTELYSPETELYYLGCVNYFLLEASKQTPEYEKLMFEDPLSECKFDELQLLINWRAQFSSSMAPMFANSLSSRLEQPQMLGVRATTSLKVFTPTASSLDFTSSLNSTSSLLVTPSPDLMSKPRPIDRSQGFLQDTPKEEGIKHSRRFLRKDKLSLGFAKQETSKRDVTEKQRRERLKRKEGNIMVYRQYRKGELPDVQIPNSAIIKPLQVLARRDGFLARQLYVMLFSSLINDSKSIDGFIENYNSGMLSLFTQTYMYVPNVIGAFLDVTFEHNKKKNVRKIELHPDLLSNVCKNSGLLPIGCLLLEEYISSNDEIEEPSSSKKGCGVSSNKVNYWVKLADMYKELNEWDTVLGIFSSKHMDQSEDISKAIQAEANDQWRNALGLYNNLLQTDTNHNRKDFYYESYFKCYANLSEWSNISQAVVDVTENTLWDGDYNQEKLLPWYMTAETCSILEGGQNPTIIENLNKWMKEKDKSEYLKDKFSEELAVLSLIQNDVNASKHYTRNCFSKFLEDWSHLNPLFSKIRSKKLINFQKVIDLNKYLFTNDDEAVDLINYYQKNCSLSSFSLINTEMRTLYRQQLFKTLKQKLIAQDCEEHILELENLRLNNDISLIDNSLENSNYAIARKYCRKNKQYIGSQSNPIASFKLSLSMSKAATIIAQSALHSEKVQKLIDSWKLIEKESEKYRDQYIDLQIESSQQIFTINQCILEEIRTDSKLLKSHQNVIKSLISSKVDCLVDLKNYSINKLRGAISLGETNSSNTKIRKNLIETYLKFIVFVQNEDDEMYHKDIVKYVLRAMKLGSGHARQLFPCLLDLPHLKNELMDMFKEESSSVPIWMFIVWIPQLLSNLNTENCNAICDIVLRLATTYPQALIYAYRITKENYAHDNNITQNLDNILNSDLVDRFLTELATVCVPELYANYYLKKMAKHINNVEILKQKFNDLKTDISCKLKTFKEFKNVDSSIKKLERKIIGTKNEQTIRKYIKEVVEENADIAKNVKPSKYSKMKICSQWLANFKASDWTTELEIPGQYTGETKPLIKYHAKISSFHSQITMFSSLRKPFKIVIYGNDAKEYSFLNKFGEDLRQDQRIQQLFTLANNILQNDDQCQQRNLYLEQYQVIPLTTALGLIKMRENNVALKKFMEDTADEKTQKSFAKLDAHYIKWLGSGNFAECHAKVFAKYSKDETNKQFTFLVNSVPADILSKAFWTISKDTESYTYLRHQFITSYSTMCLVHWLLGIGDRNLDNCLILRDTGRAIGIDFGYAFGTATQHLPIPEIFPFRLTPHILYLMEPLQEIGFVEHTMIHVLRALRQYKHILLSTMNIFVKEPSVDWLELANKQNDDKATEWYPYEKIQIASRKLDGANSAAITVEELHKNPNINFEDYAKIARGDETNKRAQLPKHGLSVEEQVQCLLDHATDYNILGRMYIGLKMWF